MSSNMLYGKKHCGVQQLLPVENFEAMSVLHLPNKNYRRVGRKGRLGGYVDGATNATKGKYPGSFEGPSSLLLSELEFHIALRKKFPIPNNGPYNGVITMVNEIGSH